MKDIIAKCGCNCSKCPSYKENLQTIHRRKQCSWGWEKYLNIRLSPEKLLLCDGCQVPDEKRKVYYLNCRVRKCARKNGIENCAYCSIYPCQDVLNIHEIQRPDAREKIEDRLGTPIPQEDYLSFIEPYEGIKHLDEIRNSLNSIDIVEMSQFSIKPKIASFPKDLPFSKEEKLLYEQIHQILSSLAVYENISYARQVAVIKNRKQLLKFLWAFGQLGEINKEHGLYLVLRSEIYSTQKILSNYSKVQEYFRTLKDYGICCEIVPTKEKGWITPSGGLRREGWFMKMSFDEYIGGVFTLKAFKNYSIVLCEQYGKNAFRYFSRADMRILC